MQNRHIPHIVGLRAIAVIIIILFHLGIPYFKGGYIGVDIFFVISGFLITRMIIEEFEESGSFRFKRFYLRRARRLLPALFATLFLTLLFGCLLFTPQDLQRLGDVIWRCPIAIANLYFWGESNYFDVSSTLKPLLHTWSLSVEEQFYIAWPLTLIVILRYRNKTPLYFSLLAFILISYGSVFVFQGGQIEWINKISEQMANGSSTVFYLVPFRVYEFLIGAMIVPIVTRYKKPAKLIISGLGLLSIAIPCTFLSESLVGSSAYNILPCLGTAALIISGAHPLSKWILTNSISRWIGNISYSLYLVHWPVIAFIKYYKGAELSAKDRMLALVLTFLIAAAINVWIETPFRFARTAAYLKNNRLFILLNGSAAIALLIVGEEINRNRGWTWRLSSQQQRLIADLKDPKRFHIDHFGGARHGQIGYFDPTDHKHADIILIGDSHIEQYAEGFYKTFYQKLGSKIFLTHWSQLFLPDCRRMDQGENFYQGFLIQFNGAIEVGRENPNAVFILGESWEDRILVTGVRVVGSSEFMRIGYNSDGIDLVLSKIRKLKDLIGATHKLIVFGSVPGARNSEGTLDLLLRPNFIPRRSYASRTVKNEQANGFELNRIFAERLPKISGVYFLNPYDVLSENGEPLVIIDDRIIYSDGLHLSLNGSEIVIRYFESRIVDIMKR